MVATDMDVLFMWVYTADQFLSSYIIHKNSLFVSRLSIEMLFDVL